MRPVIAVLIAVLFATVTMAVLMYVLLKRVTPLRCADMLPPQSPALLCAFAIGVVAFAIEYGTRSVLSHSPFLMLVVKSVGCGVVYLIFLLFAPLPDLRALVSEIAHDLVPKSVKRLPVVRTLLEWQTLAEPSSPSSAA